MALRSLLAVCVGGVAFLMFFLVRLCIDGNAWRCRSVHIVEPPEQDVDPRPSIGVVRSTPKRLRRKLRVQGQHPSAETSDADTHAAVRSRLRSMG